jgi:hypothetical protein
MEVGIYKDLSNETYHGHEESISRSAIMDFMDSPYKYWANYINPERKERESTPAMLFGEAFHTLILEPSEFDKRFSVSPEIERLPKVGLLRDLGRPEYDKQKRERDSISLANKIRQEEFETESEGKKLLTSKEYETLKEMRECLLKHPKAMGLIEGAACEQSYFWIDEHSGFMIKARPDILHSNMIVDLKTCRDASPRAFQGAMVDGGYHIQGAIIRDGVMVLEGRDIPNVINIAVETRYPYQIGIYMIDEFALEHGHLQYKQALLDMKAAFEKNEFPSYGVQTISLPPWALK